MQLNRNATTLTVLWTIHTSMLIATYFSAFCIGIWLYEKSQRSITDLSRLNFLSDLPGILLMPISGLIIDRFSRKMVLAGSVVISALSAAVLYLVSAHYSELHNGHIVLSYLLMSVANAFYSPNIASSISLLTTADKYTRVNGLFDASDGLAQLVSPIIGGLVMSTSNHIHLAVTINAALYIVPLLLLPFIQYDLSAATADPSVEAASEWSWRVLFVGARLIAERGLLSVLVLNTVNYLVIINLMELDMPVTLHVTTASVHGFIQSLQGASMILGGVLSGRWSSSNHLRMVTATTAIQCVLVFGLSLQWTSVFNVGLIMCLIMFLDPFIASNQRTVWQQTMPVSLHGRVFAFIKMAESLLLFLIALVLGPFTDHWLTPWAAKYLSAHKAVLGVHLAVFIFALLQTCTLVSVLWTRRSSRVKVA